MVVSRIIPSITFPELSSFYPSDKHTTFTIYEYTLGDIIFEVAIGSIQSLSHTHSIVFVPIYLIHNDEFVSTIGVYEMQVDKILEYQNNKGDIDIELLHEPLLYSFVTEDYLKEYQLHPDYWLKDVIHSDTNPIHLDRSIYYYNIYDTIASASNDITGKDIKDFLKIIYKDIIAENKKNITSEELEYIDKIDYIHDTKQCLSDIQEINNNAYNDRIIENLQKYYGRIIILNEKNKMDYINGEKIYNINEGDHKIIIYKDKKLYYPLYIHLKEIK